MTLFVATRVTHGLVTHIARLFFDAGGSSSKGKAVRGVVIKDSGTWREDQHTEDT